MDFYVMQIRSANYFYAKTKNDQYIVKKCPMCGSVRQERKYEQLKITIMGKMKADYVFSPYYHIVSSKMLKLLSDNEISGFLGNDINCIEWRDRNGILLNQDIPALKELIVTGRCGRLKTKNNIEIPECPKCGALIKSLWKKEKGFVVDEWDSSDMFHFKNWRGPIIVTDKVKCLLEKNKMKNIKFQRLDEFQFS